MSRAICVGLVLACAAAVRADKPLYTATVVPPEIDVRAGAGDSPNMYPTNRLRKGEKVEVVGETEGGWLAVRPPAGSFSWINSRHVQKGGYPNQWVVAIPREENKDRVPVLMGSSVRKEKPTVLGPKLANGTILTAVGPMLQDQDGKWLPVLSPPSEVRYVRKQDVRRDGPPGPAAPKVPEGPPGAVPLLPDEPAASPAAKAPAAKDDSLWQRAQEAEKALQYTEAVRLYKEYARQVQATNHGHAMQALSKAQWLEDMMRGARPAAGDAVRTTARQPADAPAPGTAPAGWVTVGPGYLRQAGGLVDTQSSYHLVDRYDKPVAFVLPQRGTTLNDYVGQYVELQGVRQWRADLRKNVLTVMKVRRVP